MDCCNYLPYKNHYYGNQQYFEQMPQYPPREYYNPPYPEYYGNTPYYPSHPWQCGAPSFPDYVYNPKEARIRKAMRDASRERAMGVAPTNRGGRRAQPWVLPESEEQFMMTPSHGMRGVVGSPMCGNGFPIGNMGNGQFMPAMHSYKHMHLISHETGGYLQNNPIAQLQHQTDMWHQYHQAPSPMRQTESFMLPQSQMPTYHHQPPTEVMATNISPPVEKNKVVPESYPSPENSVSPHTNENIPPNNNDVRMNEQTFANKVEPMMETTTAHQPEPFLNVYQENIVVQNPFDKADNSKIKKSAPPVNNTVKPQKSLPDFNEAFGSTERGRFQSPPDPRLPHKQGYLDYFFTNNDLKFDDYHI